MLLNRLYKQCRAHAMLRRFNWHSFTMSKSEPDSMETDQNKKQNIQINKDNQNLWPQPQVSPEIQRFEQSCFEDVTYREEIQGFEDVQEELLEQFQNFNQFVLQALQYYSSIKNLEITPDGEIIQEEQENTDIEKKKKRRREWESSQSLRKFREHILLQDTLGYYQFVLPLDLTFLAELIDQQSTDLAQGKIIQANEALTFYRQGIRISSDILLKDLRINNHQNMTIYLKAGLLEGPEIVNDKMVSIIFYELPYTKNYFLLNLVPYHNDFWNQNAKHRRFMGKYQKNINELVLPVLRNPAEIEKHHLDPLRLLYVLARSSLSDSQQLSNLLLEEITKLQFNDIPLPVCQRQTSYILKSKFSRQVWNALLDNIVKVTKTFDQFLITMGLSILLLDQLVIHASSLIILFTLLQANVDNYEIMTSTVIPEALKHGLSNCQQFYLQEYFKWESGTTKPYVPIYCLSKNLFLQPPGSEQFSLTIHYSKGLKHSHLKLKDRQREANYLQLPGIKMVHNLMAGRYNDTWDYFQTKILLYQTQKCQEETNKDIFEARRLHFESEEAKGMYYFNTFMQKNWELDKPASLDEAVFPKKKIDYFCDEQGNQLVAYARSQDEQLAEEGQNSGEEQNTEEDDNTRKDDNTGNDDNTGEDYNPQKGTEVNQMHKYEQNGYQLHRNESIKLRDRTQKSEQTEYRTRKPFFGSRTDRSFSTSKPSDESPQNDQKSKWKDPKVIAEHQRRISRGVAQSLEYGKVDGSSARSKAIMKYLFLHGKSEEWKHSDAIHKTLKFEYQLSMGNVQRDFTKYLQGNQFAFPLSQQMYLQLLTDQQKHFQRFHFKCIVTHLICYSEKLRDEVLKLICSICMKESIGYTFVDIVQLAKTNSIPVTEEGLHLIIDCWQNYEQLNDDMLLFTREYCKTINLPFRISYFTLFIRNLLRQFRFEKLELLVNQLLQQLKPKNYRINSSLSSEENIHNEKEYKSAEKERYLLVLAELLETVVLNISTKVPPCIVKIFNDYIVQKKTLSGRDMSLALIAYSEDVPKTLDMFKNLKTEPESINSFTYDCALKAVTLNVNGLSDQLDDIFEHLLKRKRLVLTSVQVDASFRVLRRLQNTNSFTKILEHFLLFQDNFTAAQKSEMYYIMNNCADDLSKGSILNSLDLIFSPKREKERIEFRKVHFEEEEKVKKLEEIRKSKYTLETDKSKEKSAEKAGEQKGEQKGDKKTEKTQKTQESQKAAQESKKSIKEKDKKDTDTKQDQNKGKQGAPKGSDSETVPKDQTVKPEEHKEKKKPQKTDSQKKKEQKKQKKMKADQKLIGSIEMTNSQGIYDISSFNEGVWKLNKPELRRKDLRRSSIKHFLYLYGPKQVIDKEAEGEEEEKNKRPKVEKKSEKKKA